MNALLIPRALVTLLCAVNLCLTFNVDIKFPLVYDAGNQGEGSFFGYSVALHKNNDGYLALVAGPKANSTFHRDIVEPGVLFKCAIETESSAGKPCKEIHLDRTGNTVKNLGQEYSFKDKKDGMWLGVSLDVQPVEPYHVVVCGHLWKNQYYTGHLLVNGVCYMMSQDLNLGTTAKLLPLNGRSKQSIIPPGVYFYALGQAGTSATFSEGGQDLLIGAPGVYDWFGTVVEYKVPHFTNSEMKPKIPDFPWSEKPSSESYIGYSVTSGRFFALGGMSYVAGAPRDAENNGRVYVFEKLGLATHNRFIMQQKLEGEQLGEYFGGSLLGVNLDNDDYTDLLVGAPLHSSKNGGDEGRIFVYHSDGVGLQLQKGEFMGSKTPGSRFGSSIANIGDINQDGFTDIAVGAPYEEGTGAVYIYHGAKAGLKLEYSQRISAKQLNKGLKGFGCSIARAMDIDNNLYPDLLVGAYSSDQAVLLRSRPVIQVSPRVEFNVSQIDVNKTSCEFKGRKVACFRVATCLKYSGKHVSNVIDFLVRLELDVAQEGNQRPKRGYFYHEDRVTTSLVEGFSLQLGKHQCFERLVHVHEDIQDFISPMVFQMNYSLARDSQPEKAFCGSCPLLDPATQTSITNEILFRTGCGEDNTCTSDLKVKAFVVGLPEDEPIILGANDSITVDVRVENRGEAAYASSLFIKLPPEVLIINQAHCHIVDTLEDALEDDKTGDETEAPKERGSSLECKLGNPLPSGVSSLLQIKLDISKLDYNIEHILIEMEAKTASVDQNLRDNHIYLKVPFKAFADITIRGHADREEIVYQTSSDIVPIVHKYVILKYLPSPIKSVGVGIYIPLTDQISGEQLVEIDSIEVGDGKSTVPGSCNVTLAETAEGKINYDRPKHGDDDHSGKDAPNTINLLNERSRRSIQGGELVKKDEATIEEMEKKAPREKREDRWWEKGNKNRILNCTNMVCKVLVCSVGPFVDTNKVATITIKALANMTAIKNAFGDTGNVSFITEGRVWIRDYNYDPQPEGHKPDYDFAVTSLISPHQPSKPVDNWIIAISVGVGFLLLALILLALLHFGFFRRQEREDMQKMMQEGALISEKGPENEGEADENNEELDYINFANSNT